MSRAHLETLVEALLSRVLTPADLPMLRQVVVEQRQLIEEAYRIVGKQKHLIESLTLENEQLRAVIDDQDDAGAWDPEDLRW
jgi:hypothetical protein